MRTRKLAAAAALGFAAIGLSACATGPNTQVSRYQPAAIPAGQSFYVVPAHGQPGAEFNRYAAIVAQQLETKGFRPAGAPQIADMLVKLDYGVDEGKTQVVDDPFYGPSRFGYGPSLGRGWRDPFYDPYWSSYGGGASWSRWGGYPYSYGPYSYWPDEPYWNDPRYNAPPSRPLVSGGRFGRYAPYGGRYSDTDSAPAESSYRGPVRELTVYKSYLDMDIVRRADNAQLFQGHAKARAQSEDMDKVVRPLIEAMFKDFPGKSGETVNIARRPRKD